jgi:hypothetical protein
MKLKPIPFKYAQRGSRLYLTERQIELSKQAKPGKVFGGVKIGKSELRAIVWDREKVRL